MAGKITDYPTTTTLIDEDLFDLSKYDGVSAYATNAIKWEDILKEIQIDLTFNNLYNNNGTLAGNRIVSMGVNDLTFGSTGDANLLKFETTNDRIGIGTAAPTKKLDVVGGALIASATDDTEIGGNVVNGRMKVVAGLSYMQIQNASLSNTIANSCITNDSTGFTTVNAVTTLSLRSSNVAHLDITTNLIQNKKSTEFLDYLRVTGDGAAMALGQTTDVNTALLIKSNRTDILNIGSVSTTYLKMLQSGNVGIGTSTPTDSLQVVGNLNATRYKVNGVAGANFTGAVTNITVVDGLVTAVS